MVGHRPRTFRSLGIRLEVLSNQKAVWSLFMRNMRLSFRGACGVGAEAVHTQRTWAVASIKRALPRRNHAGWIGSFAGVSAENPTDCLQPNT